MITHTVENVIVSQTDTGDQTSFSFVAVSLDELTGNRAVQAVNDVPLHDELIRTGEQLQALAIEIAEQRNVFASLDMQVGAANTPMYVAPPPPPPPTLQEVKDSLMRRIDDRVAFVSSAFTRFQMEYEEREKAAIAYRDAGYQGDPTTWITVFADEIGISYQAATDLILSQATALRNAVHALGNARMSKYRLLAATTVQEAQNYYDEIIAEIDNIEQGLP